MGTKVIIERETEKSSINEVLEKEPYEDSEDFIERVKEKLEEILDR